MSELPQENSQPQAQEPERPARPARPARPENPPRRWLSPTPEVRRVGKTAVLVVLVAVLGLMTLLSFRYSRQATSGSATEAPTSAWGEAPLAPEEIERMEPAPLPEPSEPNPLLAKLLEAERSRRGEDRSGFSPEQPSRSRRSVEPPTRRRAAPLEVRRPAGRRSAEPSAQPSDPTTDLLKLSLAGVNLPTPGTASPASPQPADPRVLDHPASSDSPFTTVSPPPPAPLLREGTILPAVLTQTLRSDLAGPVRAVITRDVYDSLALARVVIPRGTLALGRQSRQPLFGETRLLVLWHRLVLPDGRSVDLAEAPATGPDGALGLAGRVDHHWGKRFAAVGLLSLVGAGVQLSQPRRAASGLEAPDPGQLAAGELGLELGRLSHEILRRAVDVPPTVSLTPGARLGILVTRDLVFPGAPGQEAAP